MKQKKILGVSSVVSEKGLIFGMFFFWGGGRRLIFVQRWFGVSLETLGFFFCGVEGWADFCLHSIIPSLEIRCTYLPLANWVPNKELLHFSKITQLAFAHVKQ